MTLREVITSCVDKIKEANPTLEGVQLINAILRYDHMRGIYEKIEEKGVKPKDLTFNIFVEIAKQRAMEAQMFAQFNGFNFKRK